MIQPAQGRHGGRPNVVVFLTDQQRWDSTGLGGNPLELTPNFDRVASRGTYVEQAFTPQPVCGPARSCLQTGLYATTTGCCVNGVGLPANARTLAHYFRDGGYHTGYIGKWHLAGKDNGHGAVAESRRGGYQHWLAAEALEHESDAYSCVVYDNDNQPVRLPGYRVDALASAAIDYIDDHQAEPFFLFLSFLEPHQQNHRDDFPAPDGYAERYTDRWTPPDLRALVGSSPQHLGGYWGMVKRLDEAFGRMIDALKSLELLENTIVVFSSDHGCHFKTRNSEYKRSCHESSIRVPLSFSGPGFERGGHVRQMVSLLDIPPTLLAAAGLEVPSNMQGRSILPLLQPGRADWPDDLLVQLSEAEIGRALRTARWKYGVIAPGKPAKDCHADRYEERYLYDLQADPCELSNLIGVESHLEVATMMRTRLLKKMTAAGEPPCVINSAPPDGKWTNRLVLPGETLM